MNPLRRTAYTFCTVCILGFVLGSFGGFLDSMDSRHDEWAESQALVDAQMAAAKDFRKQKAAQDLCLSTVGESVPVWTADGELICKPRKAKK